MIKTALGVLAVTICSPVFADASMIGGTGGAVDLQFEPHYLRAWRDEARPLRPQGAGPGDVAFDPPSVSSPPSVGGVCTGGCRDPLPVTGGGNTVAQVLPPNPNSWERGSEEDIWSEAPDPSNQEAALIPDRSGPEGVLDSRNGLGVPMDIGGDGNIGEAPEPSTVLLMGGALVGLGLFRKKRNS